MTDTSRLVSEASAQIGRMGSAFYFTEPAISKGAELGLGTFRFYVLGRGGVLGDVDAAEVQSAFGYFAEGIIRTQWDKARTILDPRTAALEYMACCAEFGRTKFSSLEGLEPLCAALDAVNDAADPAGLALYAGIRAEPLAGDPPARAMQLVTVLREYRGSAHLVAIVAQLLDPKIAHFIARPEMWNGFGYSDDEKPEVTDEHRRKLAAANGLTDSIVAQAYGALDDAQADALLSGLSAMERALAG